MAYQMAFFAAASIEKINAAILAGTVSYPAYVFIRSEEDESVGQLGFVDKDNTLKLIKGENKKQVLNVSVLPDVSDGDSEVLYICDGIVYSFNGESYVPAYKDYTEDIDELKGKVTTLEKNTTEMAEQIKVLEETVENIEVSSGLAFIELE